MRVWWWSIDLPCSSFDELKQRRVAAQGWADLGDLTCLFRKDLDVIKEVIQHLGLVTFKNIADKDRRVLMSAFVTMLHSIQPGDLIVAKEGNSVKGICEVCEGSFFIYDRDGSMSGIKPEQFWPDRGYFEYAQSLYPVKWVDWSQLNIIVTPGRRGVNQMQQKAQRVIDAWQEYRLQQPGFEPCCQELMSESSVARRIYQDKPKGCVQWLKEKKMEIHKRSQEILLKRDFDLLQGNLKEFGQVILCGPPGTGKTFLAKRFAEEHWRLKKCSPSYTGKGCYRIVQFHPSYNYEDFVRGIRVSTPDGNPVYEVVDRVLGRMVEDAANAGKTKETAGAQALPADSGPQDEGSQQEGMPRFLLIIDEINRANLAAVMGELIYALEYRTEGVDTPYEIPGKGNGLTIPKNLYIIGTMNTADRSIGHIDYAVRRRFAFLTCLPDEEKLKYYYDTPNTRNSLLYRKAVDLFRAVAKLFDSVDSGGNLSRDFHKDDVQAGHTYFMADSYEGLVRKFVYQVYPLLREYYKDGILVPVLAPDSDNKEEITIKITGLPMTISVHDPMDSNEIYGHLLQWCNENVSLGSEEEDLSTELDAGSMNHSQEVDKDNDAPSAKLEVVSTKPARIGEESGQKVIED